MKGDNLEMEKSGSENFNGGRWWFLGTDSPPHLPVCKFK